MRFNEWLGPRCHNTNHGVDLGRYRATGGPQQRCPLWAFRHLIVRRTTWFSGSLKVMGNKDGCRWEKALLYCNNFCMIIDLHVF